MKLNKFLVLTLIFNFGCSQSSQISGSISTVSGLTNGPVLPLITGNNVLPLTVNGSLCNATNSVGYLNKPCVSITICSTINSTCQTIDDVLVDTGSYGLRVFKSVLNISLSTVTSGGRTVGDCQQYGGGTADWGPVELANITLGGETANQVPIELIDPTFGDSSVCSTDSAGDSFTIDNDPASTGYNAILGVGLFGADCGDFCASTPSNGQYFTCSGASCSGLAWPDKNQVTNPVTLLPQDNNGVIIALPSVALGGIPSANGYLILGIGTETNNSPAQVSDYSTTATDEFGSFTTSFNGNSDVGFIDSGSNSYLFDNPGSLTDCPNNSNDAGNYCPSSTVNLQALDIANSGAASTTVAFQVGNASAFNGNNNVFVEFGADDDGQGVFDWGLPFFLGRNVFVGFDGAPSPLGTGPYWAF